MATHFFSEKTSVFILVGVLIIVVLALVLVGVYGKSAKTQVAVPSTQATPTPFSDNQMTQLGKLRTDNLEPGVYLLKFTGSNKSGESSTKGSRFEILANGNVSTPTPTVTPVDGYSPDQSASLLPISR